MKCLFIIIIMGVRKINNPLVSVIIPVYNVENYLEECLNTVLNQSYKNIETIAINDGSTDDSAKILEIYKKKYNIKLIHQTNQGQSVARNRGINIAQGKYIYFLDADDFIEYNTLEIAMSNIIEYDLDLIQFGAKSFSQDIDIQYNKYKYNLKPHY